MARQTRKAPCEVCTTRKLTKKSGLYKLKSGDTHLRAYLPATNAIKTNPHGKETVKLEGLKPNRILFYFATNSKVFTLEIKHFTNAYDKLQNSGVVKTDGKGNAIVKVDCPQVYLADDGKIYSRHIHIIYWCGASKSGGWGSRIYTHQIFCNIDKAFVKKMMTNINKQDKQDNKNKVVIIDALPEEYFSKKHIKGAVNLSAKHKWTLEEVMKKLPYGTNSTTPIIIYCYSPECTAAEKLWEQLNRLGFYNTMHYLGGISDWDGSVEGSDV